MMGGGIPSMMFWAFPTWILHQEQLLRQECSWIDECDWNVWLECWLERDDNSFLAQPVTMKKRTILTSCKNRPRALKREDMHGTSLLFKYGFCCRLGQTLSFPLYPQSDCYICQQFPEEMPHTHTHTVLCTALHTHAPTSLKTHVHMWTEGLKRNKSCRAGWSPFCFLSKSFIFAPQQECRSAPSSYSIAFPSVRGTEGCLYLCAMHIRVGPCSVSPVRPHRGLSESFVGFLRLRGCDYKEKCWFVTKRAQGPWKQRTIWRRNYTSPPQRGHRYIASHYKRRPAVVLSLIPSICPLPLLPPSSGPSFLLCIRTEECYPLVAGHHATGRWERRKRVKGTESREKRVRLEEQTHFYC